jgi:hypothetical protein
LLDELLVLIALVGAQRDSAGPHPVFCMRASIATVASRSARELAASPAQRPPGRCGSP